MKKFIQSTMLTVSAFIVAGAMSPMQVNAMTELEARKLLGISTTQDLMVMGAEMNAINDIFNTPTDNITVVDSSSETPAASVQNQQEAAAPSNSVFDAVFYADKNPDLKAAYGYDNNLLYNHFLTAGMAEGRQGSENFNVFIYKENNPDLQNLFHDNLVEYYNHFINGGYLEGRIYK